MQLEGLAKSRVRWHQPGRVKLCVDGNSLASGINTDSTLLGMTGVAWKTLRPVDQQYYANVAISGQNWDAMISAATDVDGAFDATKACVLYAQEGTNQNGSTTAANNAAKTWQYVAARLAAHPWERVVIAIPPPRYLGDQTTEQASIDWNKQLDDYIGYLRSDYQANGVDGLFDWRHPTSPFAQWRYPDYKKATFFDATLYDGLSNDTAWVTEDAGGATPNQKVHPTVAANAALAPLFVEFIQRL